MKAKLTDWFDSEKKPDLVGWYQREYPHQHQVETPDWWDGKNWFYGKPGGGKSTFPVGYQRRWRGLATDPSKNKKVGKK